MTTALAILVAAPHRDNANRIFRALKDPFGHSLDGAPDPGRTFSIPLSPDGAPSPTHYGTLATGVVAQVVHDIMLNGFPTDIDWSAYSLTAQQAQQAWNTFKFQSSESWDFSAVWATFMQGQGLKKIEDEPI